MIVRLVIGLALTVLTLVVVGKRAHTIYSLIASGQPDHDRRDQVGERLKRQLVEVLGQRKLLKWTVPGMAHLFTMWAFIILLTVYIEAYGALFTPDFAIPLIGHWPVLGWLQDTIGVLCLISLVVFSIIRVRNAPRARAPGVTVLRQPHRWRVADPVHDLQRAVDAVLLPRGLLRAGRVPVQVARGPRSGSATCSKGSTSTPWRSSRAWG